MTPTDMQGKICLVTGSTRGLGKATAFALAQQHATVILGCRDLPRGEAVLAEIKADPDLRRIPVVVLTTSKAEEDVLKSYDLHANCYITKPVDLDKFIEVAKSIEDFWLTIVKLPAA